ncbi:hypothetical protein [Rhizobium rhizoryzae]|uniref:hypothetical protein n=1 Tax=Rhizobium rhizoryzae TaxID=451876 RepID=UPI00289E7CB7|nr:hypothetical protein [Rhizobium rhizoryzae]
MATFETFGRDISIATRGLTREAAAAALAKFARTELAKAIASGAGSENYTRFVNGRQGAAEESVVAPGPILYVFSNWPLIISAALEALISASPRKTGAFARSFIVIVGGKLVSDYSQILPNAEVIITNAQPYVRKVQVGSGGPKASLAPKPFDKARRAVSSRFGSGVISAQIRFLDIPSGIHPQIPYMLKRAGRRRRRAAGGNALTYPSLILNMVD